MSAQPQPRLAPEQYLEIDRASEFRNEYYNGRMYAMSGGSHPHAIVIGNLIRHLGNALVKRPCLVTASDLRVRVAPAGLYTYPDVVVVCGEPRYADNQIDTLLNPILLIEVLSPSTEAYDRGFKSAQYRTLESLQEYALVSQAEPRVEVFRRQEGGHWLLSEFVGSEAVCRFESVGASVTLGEVYENVTFGGAEVPSKPSPGS
jgi:Uma2 family endonuclease